MARKSKKEIEVIDRGGAKTVAKKTSFITATKRVFWVVSILWIVFVIWAPLHVKNTYSQPIKKSIVVSMFFDVQRNMVKQYEKMLDGIKDAINLDKPVAAAIDKVKMAEKAVDKVSDTTATAKQKTAQVKSQTQGVKALSGVAAKFGVNTKGVDKAVAAVDNTVASADKAIATVDNTAALVNAKLDSVEKNLSSVLQTEFDKMIDAAIKKQLDKNTGGLGSTLLTNYGIKHVYPWRPSSWPVATKIYDDLAKSDVDILTALTGTVDTYFGYVAWGLVVAAWAVAFLVWFMLFKKVRAMLRPFIVCPRCGHTFTDRRTAYGILKAFQPWRWL